jgi:FkbM family methyltransferase
MISYAQNLEDVLLARVFREQSTGFYVDVGAADPTEASITKHFYDSNWRGINVEPGCRFSKLAQARPRDINLSMALSDSPGKRMFVEYLDIPTRSGLEATLYIDPAGLGESIRHEVPVRTLRDVLAEHAPDTIDFMSVDVEGHEREVLSGNDWTRFRPRVLVIESTLPNTSTPCHERFEPILTAAGYQYVYFDGINRYYLRSEDSALAVHFQVPVNCFDNYKTYREIQTEQRLHDSHQQLDAHLLKKVEAQRKEIEWRTQVMETQRKEIDLRVEQRGERCLELDSLIAGMGPRTLKLVIWIARCLTRIRSVLRLLSGPRG